MTERRTALVTGASRGIGRAIAAELAGRGMQVIGTSTTEAGAAALQASLATDGADHVALCLDVCAPASVNAFFETLTARNLSPLVLVNNAGITRDNLLLRMKDEDWRQVIEANLTSIFTLSKHFVRAMIKARYGRIVNITSVVGASGNAGQANYAAAKAGIIGFTKSLAQEVAARGVTINAVAPGMIDARTDRCPARGHVDPHSGRPARLGGRDCRGSRLSRIRTGCLHHGRNPAREWWHVHGLRRALMPALCAVVFEK